MIRIGPGPAAVSLNIEETPIAPPRVPTLRWPVHWWASELPPASDAPRFPLKHELAYRDSDEGRLASVEFRSALREARRLLIMDQHFDRRDGHNPLCQLLDTKSLAEVKILTKASSTVDVSGMRDELFELLSVALPNHVTPDVQWRCGDFSGFSLHDRFAIVDDELWHFGATVGGAHRSVNAFSRGWSAKETGALQYFFELWGDD
jgi:hypothetical protein